MEPLRYLWLSTEDPNVELEPITKTEIIKAIKTIKNNQTSGLDRISEEFIKLKEPLSIIRLTHFYNNIWNQQKIGKWESSLNFKKKETFIPWSKKWQKMM